VKPYSNRGDSKKEQVRDMFDSISGAYDFFNHFLSLGIDKYWRKKMIRQSLSSSSPTEILDLATGTADVALSLHKAHPEANITGVDLSPAMIVKGKEKVFKKELNQHIQLQVGDAENLEFEDESFDLVTVAFGVRNFEGLEQGLLEIKRVLRKGGRMVILEFSKPSGFIFKPLFLFYFKYILPQLGKWFSNDPKAYDYLYESVQEFPDQERFSEIIKDLGFCNVSITQLSRGICTIYRAEK